MDNCIKFLYLLTAECNGRLNDPNSIFEVNYALNPQNSLNLFTHERREMASFRPRASSCNVYLC